MELSSPPKITWSLRDDNSLAHTHCDPRGEDYVYRSPVRPIPRAAWTKRIEKQWRPLAFLACNESVGRRRTRGIRVAGISERMSPKAIKTILSGREEGGFGVNSAKATVFRDGVAPGQCSETSWGQLSAGAETAVDEPMRRARRRNQSAISTRHHASGTSVYHGLQPAAYTRWTRLTEINPCRRPHPSMMKELRR